MAPAKVRKVVNKLTIDTTNAAQCEGTGFTDAAQILNSNALHRVVLLDFLNFRIYLFSRVRGPVCDWRLAQREENGMER